MSPSKLSALEHVGCPVAPQATNGELSHRTDPDQQGDSARGRIVCVLGMHRSGTSAATRLMNLLGIDLGAEEHLLGPRPDNPKGFWEYQPIVDLNEEILGRLGGDWREPPPLPPGWETADEFADLRQRARDLVARSFASADWGWKDPRTCLTLPFWKQILPPVHYVICMRSPAEVAASLEQREGLPREKSIRLWQVYTGAAIEQTAGLPRHFLFYEDLIQSHREEISRLARFLGRSEALAQPVIPAAIDDFLEPEFHHQRTSLINTLDNPNILFPAKALYFAVRIAARRGGSCHGLSDIEGRDPLGEQVWPVFSHSARGPRRTAMSWPATGRTWSRGWARSPRTHMSFEFGFPTWRSRRPIAKRRTRRSRPDRANWRRTIDGWPRSGTGPRRWRTSSAPRWRGARPPVRNRRG